MMKETVKKLPRPPVMIGDVAFHCYRDGLFTPFWADGDDGCRRVYSNFGKSTYTAAANGKTIGRLFRSKEAAMRAAVAVEAAPC